MTTWAQLVDSHALNVISGSGTLQEELGHRFAPGFDGGHPGVPWQVVPSGTLNGAHNNGDGTFTNPGPVPLPPDPPLDHSLQRRALILGKARQLDKAGKYLEANALRATL